MPLHRAALIGCAVTTGVGAVIHTAGVVPGSTVAVIGCGGVDFYLAGKLNLDDMISKHVSLESVNDAYDEMLTGTLARSVINFDV